MSATTIEKSIFINGSPQQVWAFITEAEKLGQWYHKAKADLAPGAPYELLDNEGKGETQVWGRVLEMHPHTLLKTTFCVGPFGDRETIVTWTLEEAAGGTKLSLVHEGVAKAAGDAALHLLGALDSGWDSHFGRLRAVLN